MTFFKFLFYHIGKVLKCEQMNKKLLNARNKLSKREYFEFASNVDLWMSVSLVPTICYENLCPQFVM